MIRPTNQNSGVASVASVTLQKLVVPLKVLNIDDRELTMLKEIVLFNPGGFYVGGVVIDKGFYIGPVHTRLWCVVNGWEGQSAYCS